MSKQKDNNGSKNTEEPRNKMGVHQERFADFMKYLKENNAEIKIKGKPNRFGETYSKTYSFTGEHYPILNLIEVALNIKGTTAREYISRSRPRKTTYRAKKGGPGAYHSIAAIQYYFLSDGDIDEKSIFESEDTPFSLRKNESKLGESTDDVLLHDRVPHSFDYHKNPKKAKAELNRNFLTNSIRDLFLSEIIQLRERNNNKGMAGLSPDGEGYPYSDYVEEIEPAYYFGGYFNKVHEKKMKEEKRSNAEYSRLNRTYQKLLDQYVDMVGELDKPLFMPGYIDFYVPYKKIYDIKDEKIAKLEGIKIADDSNIWKLGLRKTFAIDVADDVVNKKMTRDSRDMINYRYDIMDMVFSGGNELRDLSIEAHAVIMLTAAENIAIHRAITKLVQLWMDDIRFIIYAPNKFGQIQSQELGLSLDEMSVLIENYYLKDGLDACFKVKGDQILAREIFRYPEPAAVKRRESRKKIKENISRKIQNSLQISYLNGLHILCNKDFGYQVNRSTQMG